MIVKRDPQTLTDMKNSSRHILLVDDSLGYRMFMQEMITIAGHHCLLAKDGRHALELLAAEEVDLVLMDLEMPDLNGIETTKAIRKMPAGKADLPVIVLTAHDRHYFETELKGQGFDDYLNKDCRPEDLNKLLNKWCAVS